MLIFELNDGNTIPAIGYGTYKSVNGPETISSVKNAIKSGYRHIDTAAIYDNEESVGLAIQQSGISRDELFITSKVWNTNRGYESTKKAFFETLDRLQLEYLDLYLIHWPAVSTFYPDWRTINAETWRALEELKEEGLIRSIGVSNFLKEHLEALFETAEIVPAINQIEIHPGQLQKDLVEFCENKGILVEAWGPFARGKILDNPFLSSLSVELNVTVPQICLQWCLQHAILPLPKSSTPERIHSNYHFEFELTEEQMQAIDALPYIGG